jgi:glycosyltransferase involved in cell wall biosynthesis
MNIYFNRRPVGGPWGGGSKVLLAIVEECLFRKHAVFFEEEINSKKEFDVIFCVDPRPTPFVDFNSILSTKINYPKLKLIQRIGDLGTHGKPELLALIKATTQFSDVLVFPSHWAKNHLNNTDKDCRVITNAPISKFLINNKSQFEDKISIVSHHWSNNELKGFEIYKSLDDYCNSREDLRFTFIGRKPDYISIKNHVQPLDVDGLIREIPKHNVYVTASKLEAGANHVLEAMAMGLPVLYHKDGGSINEYCEGKGICYNNFEELINILENRKNDIKKVAENIKWNRTANIMAKEYVDLFEESNEG